MELFKLKNFTYYYPNTLTPALNNINGSIREGEFLLILGDSGSGKSTLARALGGFVPEFYGGKISGILNYKNESIKNISRRKLCKEIGMVFQEPDKQIVMSSVKKELAFGMENIGIEAHKIKLTIAEVAEFFSLSELIDKKTEELSGGQKQKIVLSSVLAMSRDVLILDEPTSQLDPIATDEVFNILRRLKEELGLTIILIEQKLEKCFNVADRVMYFNHGKLVTDLKTHAFIDWAKENNKYSIPSISRLFAEKKYRDIPINAAEARQKIFNNNQKPLSPDLHTYKPTENNITELNKQKTEKLSFFRKTDKEYIISIKALSFSYNKTVKALDNINIDIQASKVLCLIGGNGAGKSTLLKLLAGLLKTNSGQIFVNSKELKKITTDARLKLIGFLGQNPDDYLFNETLEEELRCTLDHTGVNNYHKVDSLLNELNILELKRSNPRLLSRGQRQLAALASVLIADTPILLIDEPAKGIDNTSKRNLGNLLKKLSEKQKKTIIMISQDIDFAAEFSDEILFLYNGECIIKGNKNEVFNSCSFYLPSVARIFKRKIDGIVTFDNALNSLPEEN